MKSKFALLMKLGVVLAVVSTLSGCFGDGGSSAAYDGTWTVSYTNSAFVPPTAGTGATVSCYVESPAATITLGGGTGSAVQTNYCLGTASPTGRTDFSYYISVAVIPSTGAVTAIVNGSTLTGQCVSTHGCAAQNGTASLSLTR
jgi:hypothetical protein